MAKRKAVDTEKVTSEDGRHSGTTGSDWQDGEGARHSGTTGSDWQNEKEVVEEKEEKTEE